MSGYFEETEDGSISYVLHGRRSETRKRNEGVVMVKKATSGKRRKRVAQWQLTLVQNKLEVAQAEAAELRTRVHQLTNVAAVDTGPVFVLKAKDVSTPDTIRFWADHAAAAGASAEKVGNALKRAIEIERWQRRNGRKVAD